MLQELSYNDNEKKTSVLFQDKRDSTTRTDNNIVFSDESHIYLHGFRNKQNY